MAKAKRRGKRRQRRKERVAARRKLMSLAMELYEDGDDAQELGEKVRESIQASEPEAKWSFFMKLLEMILPILIKLLMGV